MVCIIFHVFFRTYYVGYKINWSGCLCPWRIVSQRESSHVSDNTEKEPPSPRGAAQGSRLSLWGSVHRNGSWRWGQSSDFPEVSTMRSAGGNTGFKLGLSCQSRISSSDICFINFPKWHLIYLKIQSLHCLLKLENVLYLLKTFFIESTVCFSLFDYYLRQGYMTSIKERRSI